MKLINLLVVALSVAACLTPVMTNDALAHGGRTNSQGCHNDKKIIQVTVTNLVSGLFLSGCTHSKIKKNRG
jgi:hypothetical protein